MESYQKSSYLQISNENNNTITELTDKDLSSLSFCTENTLLDLDDKVNTMFYNTFKNLFPEKLLPNTKSKANINFYFENILNFSIKRLDSKEKKFSRIYEKSDCFVKDNNLLTSKECLINQFSNSFLLGYEEMEDFVSIVYSIIQNENLGKSQFTYISLNELLSKRLSMIKRKYIRSSRKTDYDIILEVDIIKTIQIDLLSIENSLKNLCPEIVFLFFASVNTFFSSLLKISYKPVNIKIDNYIEKVDRNIEYNIVENLSEYYCSISYILQMISFLISKIQSSQILELKFENSYFIEMTYLNNKSKAFKASSDRSMELRTILQKKFDKDDRKKYKEIDSVESIFFKIFNEENYLESKMKTIKILEEREYLKDLNTVVDPFLVSENCLSFIIKFNSLDCILFEKVNQLIIKNSKIIELSIDLFGNYNFNSFLRKLLLEGNLIGKDIINCYSYEDKYFSIYEISNSLFKLFNENMTIFSINILRRMKFLQTLRLFFNLYDVLLYDNYITSINLTIRNIIISLSIYKKLITFNLFQIESNLNLDIDSFPLEISLNDLSVMKFIFNMTVKSNLSFFNQLLPFSHCIELEMKALSIEQLSVLLKSVSQRQFNNLKILHVGLNFTYLNNKQNAYSIINTFLKGSKDKLFDFKFTASSLFYNSTKAETFLKKAIPIDDTICLYDFRIDLEDLGQYNKLKYNLYSKRFMERFIKRICLKFKVNDESSYYVMKSVLGFLCSCNQSKVLIMK